MKGAWVLWPTRMASLQLLHKPHNTLNPEKKPTTGTQHPPPPPARPTLPTHPTATRITLISHKPHISHKQQVTHRDHTYCTHLQLVCDQEARGAREHPADGGVKQGAPHVRVHCRQRVVKQVHVSRRVHRARQRHTVLLAARPAFEGTGARVMRKWVDGEFGG